ncbi:MAG: adenosylmethionine decarboxylase [Sphingobium sp.]|jgi:S-adenosylmethionine decarboxylase|uniref:S-adenosylmethionine decarboxylase proenzyme n=1 Tax=Sphingobium xenophagum TaxID=121428 RepID=A0A249MXF9_SPHXE|nr:MULTISPECIES: adenosylmethionine decarboxylase [Sphingobium]MBU0657441.1 adenosylmethionine decarboxylase [Alphaproteobacteria bacterium]ASY45895.1 adenosylmethionine decarboxylase [Sphingobium xenophagum]MBA4755404.1 adenosylmethionine decarboxylase [Sphingobium sp.]MBS91250.1 adenosylmethionine decarboxylase [Sphingobium sp.]MBU0773669.1 adenosylmethionine decarboxylase [Alphaproteobacteria bacterium]|tara:strand:+ start:857 stop:1255 length:399 start_codon:yes stop_codon:yes gene_type:complete
MIPPITYDGRHLLADLYGCPVLDDVALIDAALRGAADSAGATVIGLHLHHFGEGQGVTGVALLAESHMSIHTWPEHGYAAVDIFLCGARHDPAAALHVLCRYLSPARISQNLVRRGDVSELAREADGQKLER